MYGVDASWKPYLSGPRTDAAARLGRRLPRTRDVPDDGRGAAPVTSGAGPARERILEIPGVAPEPRGMGRLFAARSHSAVVFVSGRCRGAVLDREPDGAGPVARADDAARRLAIAAADPAWRVPALDQPPDDVLDIRGHPQPDRSRLHISLRARLPAGARSMDCARADSSRLLGGVCGASAARPGFQLRPGRGQRRIGSRRTAFRVSRNTGRKTATPRGRSTRGF